ncbi:hypothetical protein Poli38472_011843 [Pythium oligandrum]|uniref:Uncharacterized protein n=1 Tax=Pythium oligandrum TaxID=41045 RepID=A0A8K1C872_PYTOL|nr:hypothetical protein Poli38472_011843 [Pythium oligandrum]|eukprot:TMW58255.1 hypothetical protein Poli38472_011843 [Pythium oligandrum]
MFASIEGMLTDVDRILADERLQLDSEEAVDLTDLISDDQDRPIIEAIHTRMFPFSYEAAANALWTTWTSARFDMTDNLERRDARISADCVQAVLEGDFQLNSETSHFRAKMIARRVIQSNRILMPVVILMEPMTKLASKPLTGVYLRARVWNILYNTPGDDPVASRVLYSQCTPLVIDDKDHTDRGVGALMDLVLQTSSLRVNKDNQILENEMIE